MEWSHSIDERPASSRRHIFVRRDRDMRREYFNPNRKRDRTNPVTARTRAPEDRIQYLIYVARMMGVDGPISRAKEAQLVGRSLFDWEQNN